MDVKYIVIHCSDSPQGRGDDAETIHRWHKESGWDGIGYHYVVTEDGEIQPGRPEYWTGAHVKGHNHGSIGICLIGIDDFTVAQYHALGALAEILLGRYPSSEIVGHCDLDPKKTCPNFDVKAWWAACTFDNF